MFRAKTKDGKLVEGWYCKVEGRHFIILDDAELVHQYYGNEVTIFNFVEIDPATLENELLEIAQELSGIFPEPDMSDMDAADFKDRAQQTFDAAKRAETAIAKYDNP